MARWWLRSPLTFQILVGLVWLAPCLFALPYAFHGHPSDPFGGLAGLGGPIGTAVGARLRNREYWRLDRATRRRVREVQFTGRPSGDPQVDTVAAQRLSAIVKNQRASTISLWILFVPMSGLPVVAAVRTGHWWWLIAALPAVLCLPWAPPGTRRRESPGVRLDRLVGQGSLR